jgi:hypothetical protein
MKDEKLIKYWNKITGLNVEYEPNNDYEGTIILDSDRTNGITTNQLIRFEEKFGIKIKLIRWQEYGFFIDIKSKEKIEFKE